MQLADKGTRQRELLRAIAPYVVEHHGKKLMGQSSRGAFYDEDKKNLYAQGRKK